LPRGPDHYVSLKKSILYYFFDEDVGLQQKVEILAPFEWATGLAMAAKEHIKETAAEEPARRSSLGTHGSSPATRAAAYGTWTGELNEFIVYGRNDAIGVIVELLAHDHAMITDEEFADDTVNFVDSPTGKFYGCDQNLNVFQSAAFGSVLEPKMKVTGIAHGSHSQYDKMYVFMYAEDYVTDP